MFRLLPLLALVACESGLSLQAEVSVPAEVTDAYDADAPGLLRLAAGALVLDLEPVCGAALPDPVEVGFDYGFGCRDEKGASEALVAWIEPMPAAWDAAAFCATARTDTWSALDLSGFDTGALATTPDPAWPQGEGTAPWERDFSPCGGYAEGRVVVE